MLNNTRRATLVVAFLWGFQPFVALTPVVNIMKSSPAIDSKAKSEADRLNEQANRLFAEGKLRAAAQMYRRALLLAPGRPQLHFNLALAMASSDGKHVVGRRESTKWLRVVYNWHPGILLNYGTQVKKGKTD